MKMKRMSKEWSELSKIHKYVATKLVLVLSRWFFFYLLGHFSFEIKFSCQIPGSFPPTVTWPRNLDYFIYKRVKMKKLSTSLLTPSPMIKFTQRLYSLLVQNFRWVNVECSNPARGRTLQIGFVHGTAGFLLSCCPRISLCNFGTLRLPMLRCVHT